MEWYWIVMIVIGYLFMWAATSIGMSYLFNDDSDEKIAAGLFWPLVIAISPLVLITLGIKSMMYNPSDDEEDD